MMKEEITKKIIQKSIVKTSEDFTDKLMLKIETEAVSPAISNLFFPQFIRAISLITITGIVVFSCLLFLDFFPKLTFLNFEFKINKTPFLTILSLLLLTGTNYVLKLQHFINHKNDNESTSMGT